MFMWTSLSAATSRCTSGGTGICNGKGIGRRPVCCATTKRGGTWKPVKSSVREGGPTGQGERPPMHGSSYVVGRREDFRRGARRQEGNETRPSCVPGWTRSFLPPASDERAAGSRARSPTRACSGQQQRAPHRFASRRYPCCPPNAACAACWLIDRSTLICSCHLPLSFTANELTDRISVDLLALAPQSRSISLRGPCLAGTR